MNRLGKKHETLSKKITKAKRARGVAYMLKHLSYKCKGLSLTPVQPRNKNSNLKITPNCGFHYDIYRIV
jgi:hypothetical protein